MPTGKSHSDRIIGMGNGNVSWCSALNIVKTSTHLPLDAKILQFAQMDIDPSNKANIFVVVQRIYIIVYLYWLCHNNHISSSVLRLYFLLCSSFTFFFAPFKIYLYDVNGTEQNGAEHSKRKLFLVAGILVISFIRLHTHLAGCKLCVWQFTKRFFDCGFSFGNE